MNLKSILNKGEEVIFKMVENSI